MNFIKFLPIILLAYFLLTFLIKFLDENIMALKEQLQEQSITKGFLSIKDLQFSSNSRFLNAVNVYLDNSNFSSIIEIKDSSQNAVSFLAVLESQNVYVSCLQNVVSDNKDFSDNELSETPLEDIHMFVGRMIKNSCSKGVLINNSIFSTESINFINELNSSGVYQINLINGYELTKFIRIYKNLEISAEAYYD